MARIEIVNDGTVRECAEGANLLAELLRASAFVDNPCNGTGVCGKCKVRIVDGEVSKVSATEQKLLSREELAQGIRLACMTCVSGDIQVELLQKERKHKVLTEGYVPEFARDEHDEGYGVAIDIGTTTVVTSLVELASGREITSASMINVQKHFGLDVLTRITYEYEHAEEGIEQLRCAIVDSVNDMLVQVCRDEGISTEEILEIDIAANCTMMHMLLGTDARSIGRSPYQPAFLGAQKRSAGEIGLRAGMDNSALVYCLPQVSAFIGADIVAGAYVCELEKQNGNVLFIDIGTNGEIVLSQKGRLLCCSCAARTGTGRYEYQLWNAGGRRCYRRCEDHRAWSRVYLYRWKRTGGYLRKWNPGSAERTDPDRTCQKKMEHLSKKKIFQKKITVIR